MLQLNYAWDQSIDSWINVFTETLVRTLSLWVLEIQSPPIFQKQLETLTHEGFFYAQSIADTLNTQPLSEQWLIRCLTSCQQSRERRLNKT
jgi:hypothetical protein